MFPARVRFSGVSIGYAFGSIIGGAFAPMIAQLLLNRTGSAWAIGIYISALCLVSFIAVSMVRRSDQDSELHVAEVHEEYFEEHPDFVEQHPTAAQRLLADSGGDPSTVKRPER